MSDNGERRNYALPPHMAMLSDAILGISDLTKEVQELCKQLHLMREDVVQMGRSMDEFQKQVAQVKTKTIDEMIKISGETLDERLGEIDREFFRMAKELRTGGRRSHPRWQQAKNRPGLLSRLFGRKSK